MKTNKNSFTQLLKNFILNTKSKKILVEDIVDIFEVNAFYILILIFSFIIIIPMPELIALISSLINIIISIQIYIGARKVWLPKSIMKKSISKKILNKIFIKIIFILSKSEKYTKERMFFWKKPIFEKFISISILLISIISLSPIPFTNTLPGFSLILISFGFLNRDGLLIITGYLFSFLGLYIINLTLYTTIKLILKIFK